MYVYLESTPGKRSEQAVREMELRSKEVIKSTLRGCRYIVEIIFERGREASMTKGRKRCP